MDGATVEKHGMLGAGSILAPGATIKAGEFWSGMPAKMVQKVDTATIDYYLEKVEENAKLATVHMAEHEKPLLFYGEDSFNAMHEDAEREEQQKRATMWD